MSSHDIEQFIFDISRVLLIPVLIAVIVVSAMVLVELGRLGAELWHRHGRSLRSLDTAVDDIRRLLRDGNVEAATAAAATLSSSRPMAKTAEELVALPRSSQPSAASERAAKLLADFDYGSLRRLERTRILVRLGPAIGLMGTLIPLSPALSALAKGSVSSLADNLRIAFSVTVLGLLVGALAFAISLVRDRLYSQDLSDLEYLSAALDATPDPEVKPGVIIPMSGDLGEVGS
jgi:biopolymer transport protein ExbB/TolQ